MTARRSRAGGALAWLVLSLVASWILWDSVVLWPLKLLAVMVHETGHAVATLVVGGSVDRVTLASNESGACMSRLPPGFWRQIVVYSAGYVGSALAGAALLVASIRLRAPRMLVAMCGIWLAAMGLLVAGDVFTFLFCVGMAGGLGLALRYLPHGATEALGIFLSAFIALYAAFDLRSDLWDGRVRGISDAALLADLTWVPALVWAAAWSLLSLGVLLGVGVHLVRDAMRAPPEAR